MDVLLDRLWELANEDDAPNRSERVTEAQALWRALEVLLSSLKPQELTVGEGIFTKTLACIRSVLSDPSYWIVIPPVNDNSDDSFVTVFVCVNRVLLKIGSRGEQERTALVRDGIVDLIVRCGESTEPSSMLLPFEAAAALQTLQSFATDSRNRSNLQVSHIIRMCIGLMQRHASVYAVQLRACQFLHQMVLEEECKERIGRLGGLQAVSNALSRFAEETDLVVTALDLLFLLCVELGCHDGPVQYLPYRSAKTTVFQDVVAAVVDVMRVLHSVELVQASGVAVLNSTAVHSPVRQALCSLNIWDISENGLSAAVTDKTACDFVELLDSLLRDTVIFEAIHQKMSGIVSHPSDQGVSRARLKALKCQVERLQQKHVGSEDSRARMTFVSSRLQALVDELSRKAVIESFNSKREQLVRADANRIDYNGYHQIVFSSANPTVSSHASTYSDDGSGDELPVDSAGSMNYLNEVSDDNASGLLRGERTGYFNNFLQQSQGHSTNTSTGRIGSLPMTVAELNSTNHLDTSCEMPYGVKRCTKDHLTAVNQAGFTERGPDPIVLNGDAGKWQTLHDTKYREAEHSHIDISDNEFEKRRNVYDVSTREVQNVQCSSHKLNERYRIVLHRSKEQSKLLALQNVRIANYSNEQQQILRRMRTLENSLDEAERNCKVERALRLAETVQSEQLSLALNDSVREAKSLASQQSSVVHELQQNDHLRTEYMLRTRESKHSLQRVEIERDDALLQIEILKQEKMEMLQQLAECRGEGRESLLMREEDVNVRRPGMFDELTKISTTKTGAQKTNPEISTSRRNSLPTEVLAIHLSESANPQSMSSPPRSASVYPIHTRISRVNGDLNDDPNSVDTSEIQSCLVSVFESLDTSIEGTNEEGIHVSTVRRFFMESGLLQAPNVLPVDVDVVLAGVLAQAQSNRRNSLSRKDFSSTSQETWAPPTGWAKLKKRNSPTKSASFVGDVKRFRFFSQDAFNEAVTLVGMRRFPRFDLLHMLQTVVALYLRPYMRQRQPSLSIPTNQLRRSSSTCSLNRRSGVTVASPSQVCTRALKSILNELALHVGYGNEKIQSRSASINSGQVRSHSDPPASLNQSYKRDDVVYSMLEMTGILSREQRPLGTICEFYSAQHLPNATAAAAISIVKSELFGLSFERVLNFAIDFDLIPSFMDRVSLKRLHTEVAGLLKSYFALHDKDPPTGVDAETLKKVAFEMILARLALELFGSKPGYETPELQITGLLQWLDNSPGREKIMRKADIPLVIRFSRQLYSVKAQQ
ncbi:hypothetical protein L916_13612 [Phytophthora nicotianae]|uniref:Uncharacterized protein n=1 Tax=Phytophthora nicotianae TaxID=4792 RepID=W2IKS2_PHYNI|nr:hypothetical protein L916_13612 [Phytophthora nicotianae]